jgi:hypothetical protein
MANSAVVLDCGVGKRGQMSFAVCEKRGVCRLLLATKGTIKEATIDGSKRNVITLMVNNIISIEKCEVSGRRGNGFDSTISTPLLLYGT